MIYGRNPRMPGRYVRYKTTGNPGGAANMKRNSDEREEFREIPMPNESEDSAEPGQRFPKAGKPSFLDFIKSRMHFEELLLLALIFLLFEEGIDDDFLFILLIYILLT